MKMFYSVLTLAILSSSVAFGADDPETIKVTLADGASYAQIEMHRDHAPVYQTEVMMVQVVADIPVMMVLMTVEVDCPRHLSRTLKTSVAVRGSEEKIDNTTRPWNVIEYAPMRIALCGELRS